MNRKLVRALTGSAVALSVVAGTVIAMAPAQAAVIGTLTVNPANGTDLSSIALVSSGVCTDPLAEGIQAKFSGPGFPAAGINVSAYYDLASVSSSGAGYSQPIGNTLRYFANQQTPPVTTLNGQYTFTISCRAAFDPTSLGDYTTNIWFTNNAYTSTDPSAPQATTTTVTSSPASPANANTPVTFTATVNKAAAGSVQFKDNAVNLGSAVATTVGASTATATYTTSALALGSHPITADFTSSNTGSGGFLNSTSNTLTFQVNGATATTTNLTVSGGTEQGDTVTLSALVSPNNAVGSVQFFDGATLLGSSAAVSGTAVYTTTSLTVGTHANLHAVFVPTNSNAFSGSTSADQSFTVNAPTSAPATQDLQADVPNTGALTISVADTTTVIIPLALNADSSLLVGSAAIHPVTVTDTRAGNAGWTASGQVSSNFTGPNGAINSSNLGWTPSGTAQYPAVQTVVPAGTVAPAAGLLASDSTIAGLKAKSPLASAPAGASLGTATLGANLTLQAPTVTLPGTYGTVLTLTVI